MINKGYLVRLIIQAHLNVSLVHLYKGKLIPVLGRLGEGREHFLCLLSLKCLQLKLILMLSGVSLVACSDPLHWL